MKKDDIENLEKFRHPAENVYLVAIIGLVVGILVLLFYFSLNRIDLEKEITKAAVESHLTTNPQDRVLNEEQVIKKLPATYKQAINYSRLVKLGYTSIIPLLVGLGYLAFLAFTRWKKFSKMQVNSVLVDEKEFSEVYEILQALSKKMKLKKVPRMYFYFGDDLANTDIFYVLGYSDVVVMDARYIQRLNDPNGKKVFTFILAHELAKIKLRRITDILINVFSFPVVCYFIAYPFRRARIFGCDKIASLLSDDENGMSLLSHKVVLIGKKISDSEKARIFGIDSSYANVITNFFLESPILLKRQQAIARNIKGNIFFVK